MQGNRWGLPEGYNHTPITTAPEVPQVTPRIVVDKTAVQAANKTVSVLETVLNDKNIENEKLKRESSILINTIKSLESQLNTANTKIVSLEGQIQSPKQYNERLQVPVASASATDNYMQSVVTDARIYVPPLSANKIVAQDYCAPINPMTVFVEFLEELTILEDYIAVAEKDGIDFDLLCNQYSPYDYIDCVCTDDDGDFLEGWEEANNLWLTICDTDSLDDKEAYIE